MLHRGSVSAYLVFVGAVLFGAPLRAQTVSGVARETVSRAAVSRVEVSLLDSTGRSIASARTSDSGEYRIKVPGVGSYRLTARRIGFNSALSPWFMLDDAEAALTFDFALTPNPQVLAPIITEAEGDPVEIRSRFGLDTKNINAFIVPPEKVREWSASAHGIADVIRQIGIPGGLTVREDDLDMDYGEPCIQLVGRDRHCMLIIVDDIVTNHVRDLDLNSILDIVVMRPNEAGLWFGSLSTGAKGVNNPNQRSTAGGVLLIRTKMGASERKKGARE
jgi:hypothetical protein